jgi:hypothetical protein
MLLTFLATIYVVTHQDTPPQWQVATFPLVVVVAGIDAGAMFVSDRSVAVPSSRRNAAAAGLLVTPVHSLVFSPWPPEGTTSSWPASKRR